MDSYNSPTTKPIFRGTQIIRYALVTLEILLASRFILKMTAANSAASFTSFIYGVTWPFTQPFISVFQITKVEGSVFEWTTILAMLVYWIIALGIVRIFLIIKTVSTPEAANALKKQENL